MRRAASLRLLTIVVIAIVLMGAFAPLATPRAAAQSDDIGQKAFDKLVKSAADTDPAFGPDSGELELDPDFITFSNANVDLANVLISVTFTNPVASTRHSFDYGIQFRDRTNGLKDSFLTFVVLETGDWALLDEDQNLIINGVSDGFNDRRDAENALMIYANDDVVHLALNGDYLGSARVTNLRSGDVRAGSGFFTDDYIPNTSTGYADFTVWDLDSTQSAPPSTTGSQAGSSTDPASDKSGDLGSATSSDSSNTDHSAPIETATTTEQSTATATEQSTATATEQSTATATHTPESTSTPEPTETGTPTDTPEPASTSTPLATASPSDTSTEVPTATGTPRPTNTAMPGTGSPQPSTPVASPVASPITIDSDGVYHYVDPVSGIHLAYDDTWSVEEQNSTSNSSTLEINNSTSTLTFNTVPLAADRPLSGAVDDVIADLKADPNLTDVQLVTDANGIPIRTDGINSSSALVSAVRQDANGNHIEMRFYIEARSITNQPYGLVIIHSATASDYPDEIAARTKVTTTILYPTK